MMTTNIVAPNRHHRNTRQRSCGRRSVSESQYPAYTITSARKPSNSPATTGPISPSIAMISVA